MRRHRTQVSIAHLQRNPGKQLILSALVVLSLVLSSEALARTAPPVLSFAANQGGDKSIQSGVLGEVTAIDVAAKQLTVKLDSGRLLQVIVDDKTLLRRVAASDHSLANAARITLTDISVGDRVYVQGKVEAEQTSVQTRQLIVMDKETISEKRERDSADWRKRGIVGVIVATNPEKKEVTLRRGSAGAAETITLALDKARLHRYAPDSAKFSNAKPSTFEELRVGDVLRARGERSATDARFITEELVAGSFQTIGGTVTAVNPDNGELKINDIQTRRPLTVVVNKDSVLRRMKSEDAIQFVPKKQGEASKAPAEGQNADFQQVLERQPPLSIAELKTGDMILISSSKGGDPSRLTAITLVAGMDVVLKQVQGGPPKNSGPSPNTGLPIGIPLP